MSLSQKIHPEQRKLIRAFKREYPHVSQTALAKLLMVTPARISEIMRKDPKRSGV